MVLCGTVVIITIYTVSDCICWLLIPMLYWRCCLNRAQSWNEFWGFSRQYRIYKQRLNMNFSPINVSTNLTFSALYRFTHWSYIECWIEWCITAHYEIQFDVEYKDFFPESFYENWKISIFLRSIFNFLIKKFYSISCCIDGLVFSQDIWFYFIQLTFSFQKFNLKLKTHKSLQ